MRMRTEAYRATRAFVVTDVETGHLKGPECQDCHLAIFYAVDVDRWFHRDQRLIDHAARPQVQP